MEAAAEREAAAGGGEHPLFVSREEALEAGEGEIDALALRALDEVGGLEVVLAEEREDEAVGDRVAEGFEEVLGERLAAEVGLVVEAEVGVEAGGFKDSGEFLGDEGVGEGEEGVGGVEGWVAVAAVPNEGRGKAAHGAVEVDSGSGAFHTIELAGVGGSRGGWEGGSEAGGDQFEIGKGAGLGVECVEDRGSIGDFGLDEEAGGRQGGLGGGAEMVLLEAQGDVLAGRSGGAAAEDATAREETDGCSQLEEFSEGLRSDLDTAEEGEGFEVAGGKVGEDLVAGLDEKPGAGFADEGALFGDVEICHGRTS